MSQVICEEGSYAAPSATTDVLRAHQFRCKERGEAPVPEGQSKGRKRSSCLSCVKLRTKCDQETPCTRCQELGKECIRCKSWSAFPRPPNFDVLLSASSPQKTPEVPRPKSRDAIPIHHLLNAPEDDDFIGRFPIRSNPRGAVGEDDETTVGDHEDSSEASHWSEDYEHHDVFIGAEIPDLEGVNFDSFFGGFESLTFGLYPLHSDLSRITSGGGVASDTAMALEPRAYEIRQLLMESASKLADQFPEIPHNPHLASSIRLLTHTELDHCLDLFFGNYHRHCPILHRPSFQPTIVPIPLLLSTVALGAMYSPEPGKKAWMKSLLDVMEAYIFSLPGLREEYIGGLMLSEAQDEETLNSQFQLFQGGYLMVVVQYFSGNLAGRRRARRQRFSTILSIARSFGLPTAQHGSIVAIPDEAAFQRWVRNECRVRTMNIILALDSAMGIFNNVHHRVDYCELDLQMPCHPEYFELSSHAEMLRRSSFPRARIKLIDAFAKLFVSPNELKSAYQNEVLCCWDMLYLSHVLFTHCWQHLLGNPLNRISATSLAFASPAVIEPMKTALANWKTLWDDIRVNVPRSTVSEMGFETSADSYWTLTKLVVQRFEGKSPSHHHPNGAANTTTFLNGMMGNDDTASESSANSLGMGGSSTGLDFMPLEADCDSQGAHLRKILKR
ncbi:uncharacterized protein Z518_10191 [Rhinocladiella mackenziei CBS 650.93]|uniref:Zn(2)-C6 fungal-type domain-containing protein n=1 Tax=Rhinocladiella mackenziei CBS 650.93 TaxID=1442369 RepID=A0A0D2IWX8_9EURO|nr:uncharacterized protein Z518_10191 [Rhinocladiella mackenziei CBS 650.93]KIX01125.1 hypothetical protein Z518_10191 [Rhinocladiella mackenziei CBS 650.93]